MNRKYNDVQIIELHSKGLTDKEISEILGVKPSTFANKRAKLGLKPNKSKRETYKLEGEVLEILIGTLLGDACVRYVYEGCKYPMLHFNHSMKQLEYFLWKKDKLIDLMSSFKEYKIKNDKSITGSRMQFNGKNMACLKYIRELFYPNGVKQFPIEFLDKYFTELSFYCLFMDDGSFDISTNSYILNTQCFEASNLKDFCNLLLKKFNIETSIKADNTIYIKHISNDIVSNILDKYNECKSMSYKSQSSLNSVKQGNP